MIRRRQLWPALALLVACGGGAQTPDTGAPDGSAAPDAGGPTDAGPRDVGAFVDAGAPDAGTPDSGAPDAGPPPLGPVTVDVSADPPERLSEFNFFRFSGGAFEYNDGVVPYELTTPLFSDYAIKRRALYVPDGASIPYQPEGTLDFPVGSAIIKSFLFAEDLRRPEDLDLIETRVLIRYEDGWRAFPYLWREDGSDADYWVRGEVRAITFIDPSGAERTAQYLVPQKNQCLECHELKDEAGARYTTLIGPKARWLNREHAYDGALKNQLQHLADLGRLDGLPDLATVPRGVDWAGLRGTSTTALSFDEIERAARDYLDINCAHCHRPQATQGMTSRLFLNHDNEDEFHLGFCKEPGSAGSGTNGLRYDIVPGDAEASILVYRLQTEVVGDMMPLLGRSLADDLGVRIVRGWVEGLPPDDCE